MSLAERVYRRVERGPRWAQFALNTGLSILPAGLVYGKKFRSVAGAISQSEYYPRERLGQIQLENLRKLLRHARETVPYYRDIFKQVSFDPEKLTSVADLERLPFLDKPLVRSHFDRLKSSSVREEETRYVTTGGSTGDPLGFLINRDASVAEWAFMTHQWRRVGYQLKDRRAVIRGTVIDNDDPSKIWRFDPLRNELHFSSFNMTDENIATYLELIKRYQPRFLHAYPSSAAILARYVLDKRVSNLPPLRAVLAGSENVYPKQRELVEKAFGCRMYSWYGMSEKVLLGGECECSSEYHLFPQYGVMELVDEKGNVITEPGVPGEIVATGFLNAAMPFIRYRTGDIGILSDGPCKCGRHYPRLRSVEGRRQEVLVGRKGNLVSFAALNMHSSVYDRVKQYQFYQDTVGEAVIRVVPDEGYSDEDSRMILEELRRKTGDEISYTVEIVSAISLTRTGKYKAIEQHLPVDLYLEGRS